MTIAKDTIRILEDQQATMNNVLHINATSSISIPTIISLSDSLRWLRRTLTILLVLANLALTIWANALR